LHTLLVYYLDEIETVAEEVEEEKTAVTTGSAVE
jgi:hypothetical protein